MKKINYNEFFPEKINSQIQKLINVINQKRLKLKLVLGKLKWEKEFYKQE